MNNLVELIISNISKSDLVKLLGTDELRDLRGKRLREITDQPFYLSIKEFGTYSNMRLHTKVLTQFINNVVEGCCIVRLSSNISYIMLKVVDDKASIVLKTDLDEEQRKLYKERSH